MGGRAALGHRSGGGKASLGCRTARAGLWVPGPEKRPAPSGSQALGHPGVAGFQGRAEKDMEARGPGGVGWG